MKLKFQGQMIVVSTLMLIISGCASTNPTTPTSQTPTEPKTTMIPATYKAYETIDKGAVISYPSDWEVDTHNPKTIAQIYSPYEGPTDTFQENLNIVSFDLSQYNTTIEEIFEYSRSEVAEFKNYHEIETSDMTIDGNPGKKLVYTASVSDGAQIVNLKFLQAITLKNKRSFVVTCTFKENSFEKYVGICQSMIQSMKIR